MTDSLPYNLDVFEPIPRSSTGKIRCRTCLATGYPNSSWIVGGIEIENIAWWGYPHERAHGWDCSDCDLAFTTSTGLSAHRRSRHP